MRLTYDAILADPELLRDVLGAAKRERALAVERLVLAPIARLFH